MNNRDNAIERLEDELAAASYFISCLLVGVMGEKTALNLHPHHEYQYRNQSW